MGKHILDKSDASVAQARDYKLARRAARAESGPALETPVLPPAVRLGRREAAAHASQSRLAAFTRIDRGYSA